MRFTKLIIRNLLRSRTRTLLTLAGIAVSMFIFAALLGLDGGVNRMLSESSGEDVLIVFERYKACPPYSNLPVHYRHEIEQLEHVETVMPVRFLLSNCGTTTDLIAVHGVEPELLQGVRELEIEREHYSQFASERGAAIVGQLAAAKYGWQVGQQVSLPQLRGISFTVRGIFSAPGSSLEQVVLVDREYLETSINEVGRATLFTVQVDDPANADAVAMSIDSTFSNYDRQTKSGLEKGFIAGQITAFSELVQFAQLIAYLALVLLLAAVANSVSMGIRDRQREIAIMKLLGFDSARAGDLVLAETLLLGALASAIGVGASLVLFNMANITISVEGFTVVPYLPLDLGLIALLAGIILSLVGAWLPTATAARRPIVQGLKGVD
jgi:putative ABC transport system permease protein